MKAAVVQADKSAGIEEKPIPSINPNEILLKVKAVGINPTDRKISQSTAKPGYIIGCDFVGEVVEIGSEVPEGEIELEELRWGLILGSSSPDRGAFAEYVATEWDTTSKVPSNVTAEQAASLPIPFLTAVQVIFLRLKVPQYPEKFADQPWILIWGGGTAVGQYAIQLAKLSGMRVATTASPRRWALLKKQGADLTIDYGDPDAVKKLKEGTNDTIRYGLDCVTKGDSTKNAQLAMRPAAGHLVALWVWNSELPRTDVKTEVTLTGTLFGKDINYGKVFFKTSPEERPLLVKWLKLATILLQEGKIKTLEIDAIGDLSATQKGLQMMSSGQYSSKLVMTVS